VVSDAYLDLILPSPLDVMVVPGAVLLFALAFGPVAFRRFDRLARTVRERNAELERRNAALEALRGIGTAIASLANIDGVYQRIVDHARELLGADAAFIAVALPTGAYRVAARSGPAEAFANDDEVDDAREFLHPEFRSAQLAAPLRRGDVAIGTLQVGARSRPSPYGAREFETLASLASQAAIANEHERLQHILRELAIHGERARIAHEMHDGLAQVLGYVNTKAQAIEELLAVGQVERARQQLSELATAARSVYVDVRETILGLSSPIVSERGLVGALEEYVRRFTEASKLASRVEATSPARAVRLPPDVQTQVFRIVQEALTNVRKHASAQRARVRLDVKEQALTVRVEDDGKGFDPDAPLADGWPHFGMQTIRERAASIGAIVSWSGSGDEGAALALVVPLEAAVVP
jgi:signal transduction histidine kinase